MSARILHTRGGVNSQLARNPRRQHAAVRCSVQPDVDSYKRAPKAPPSSGSSTSRMPPPPPPPPSQPSPSGLSPSRRELAFLGVGGVLGAIAHTIYNNNTTITITDPNSLENLFHEALLEEEILEVKSSVTKLDIALDDINTALAADEKAVREGKAPEGKTLEEVQAEAEELRGQKVYFTQLRDDLTGLVNEMTSALKDVQK